VRYNNNYDVLKADVFILRSCLRYGLNLQVISCWISVLKPEERLPGSLCLNPLGVKAKVRNRWPMASSIDTTAHFSFDRCHRK
jgi:hypothetical protein